MADEDAFLAVGGEFRPVLGDGVVDAEQAALVGEQGGDGGDGFCGGIDVCDGVGGPGDGFGFVGVAAPDVDDVGAVDVDVDGGAELGVVGEFGLEEVGEFLEAGVGGGALDFGHGGWVCQDGEDCIVVRRVVDVLFAKEGLQLVFICSLMFRVFRVVSIVSPGWRSSRGSVRLWPPSAASWFGTYLNGQRLRKSTEEH